MPIFTLRNVLTLMNLVLLLGLASLVGLIAVHVREFQGPAGQVRLGTPPTYDEEPGTMPTRAHFSTIHQLPLGPRPSGPGPGTSPVGWLESFTARWSVKARPVVREDLTRARVVMEEVRTATQRICEVAPAGFTISQLAELADSLWLRPADLPMLLEDTRGGLALVASITREGVGLVNEHGEAGLIPYEQPDLEAALRRQCSDADGTSSRGSGTGPSGVPDRTRRIDRHTWEVGRGDQLDLRRNQARYLDELLLRPYHHSRTRRFQGVQLRSRVPRPHLLEYGLVEGDIIVRINGRPVTGADEVLRLARAIGEADRVVVELIRQGQTITVTYVLRRGATPVNGSSP